jgi:hypothetical protein
MPLPRIKCNEEECPTWSYGLWSTCSSTCGSGIRNRLVACRLYNGTVTNDINCNFDDKPAEKQTCMDLICPKWSITSWSACKLNDCLQKRDIRCLLSNGTITNDQLCDKNRKPLSQKECADTKECDIYKKKTTEAPRLNNKLPDININNRVVSKGVRVHHTAWAKCSSPCSSITGIETRSVFCRLLNFTEVSLEQCGLNDRIEKRTCRSHKPCFFKLAEEPGLCKGTCGMNGTRDVMMTCRETTTQRVMNLSDCGILYQNQTKSCLVQTCTTVKVIPNFEWKTGVWSRVSSAKYLNGKTQSLFFSFSVLAVVDLQTRREWHTVGTIKKTLQLKKLIVAAYQNQFYKLHALIQLVVMVGLLLVGQK